MLEIKLDSQPQDFLDKCENELFDRICKKLESLRSNPVPHDSKRVLGYELPTFRVRVGKIRILYRINYDSKLIVVVKIDKRDKVYD